MELSEDNTDRPEEHDIPEDLGGASGGQEFRRPPESAHPADPSIDSVGLELPQDHWSVEVVPGQVSDAANRISCAIDLLLAAAARPR